MSSAGLHPAAGHGPDLRRHVDFRPAGVPSVSPDRAAVRIDEFESERGYGLAGAKAIEEGRDLGERHRGEMAAGQLLRLCEQLIEMTPPTGGVRRALGDMPFGARRIQDGLDSAANPRCGCGLGVPDRLQHREHVLGSDLVDGLRPDRAAILGSGSGAIDSGASRSANPSRVGPRVHRRSAQMSECRSEAGDAAPSRLWGSGPPRAHSCIWPRGREP